MRAKHGFIAGLDDDLDGVELVQDVEAAFGLHLPEDELSRCNTVVDLLKLIEERLPTSEIQEQRCATAMCFYRARRSLHQCGRQVGTLNHADPG